MERDCEGGLIVLARPELGEQSASKRASSAAKHKVRGAIVIRAHPVGESVVLEVDDTGPGIGLDGRERIFDRFYRGGSRDSGGFGLGLAIVRQAARALGGGVEIAPQPNGAGTTVRVTLQRAMVPAP